METWAYSGVEKFIETHNNNFGYTSREKLPPNCKMTDISSKQGCLGNEMATWKGETQYFTAGKILRLSSSEVCKLAHKPNPAFHPVFSPHLFLEIKLYWHTATHIHLCIVKGCFHTATAEVSRGNRDHKAKNTYHLALHKRVCRPLTRSDTLFMWLWELRPVRVTGCLCQFLAQLRLKPGLLT